MNRKETTAFLSNLLISRFGSRTYWAREVSLDYGSVDVKRVDFIQFEPAGVVNVSDIEKGIFTSYEVKSCKADYNSGYGRNFETEKNYFVMPMELYKELVTEFNAGDVGVMCPVPFMTEPIDEFESPTPLDRDIRWELKVVKAARKTYRKRSMAELLFCMLRSGH